MRAMPAVEPLSPATWVAVAALLATVAALWVRPWWLWMAALGLTIVAGYVVEVLDGPAGAAFMLLAFALQRFRSRWGLARAAYATGAILVSLVLALHLGPGFHNPVILRDVVLSPGAARYSQYANFDKGLAGVLILGTVGFARLRSLAGWGAALRQAGPIAAGTIAVVMAASLAMGFVRFEPRWTPLFWVWAPINLLLTCVSEEAFFRGFLQREIAFDLQGRRHGAAIAVCLCALLFGIAHIAGGWPYVLLATLAGAGYGLAYQRSGRIEMAILTHFAVNATHFLLFTYPALA
jgi:membrane protease YdiL (CAAX protease family)